jgi:hypothetical protein
VWLPRASRATNEYEHPNCTYIHVTNVAYEAPKASCQPFIDITEVGEQHNGIICKFVNGIKPERFPRSR